MATNYGVVKAVPSQIQDEMKYQSTCESQLHHTTPTQASALDGLLSYCKDQQVYISPSIAAQTYPGRGLGVSTLKPIKKGEKLIHVPTKALLTTQSIPDSFLSKVNRQRFTVHCALAAYLAFGSEKAVGKYRPWMETWPRLEEFTESVPVFWKEDFRVKLASPTNVEAKPSIGEQVRQDSKRAKKRRKTIGEVNNHAVKDTTLPTTAPRFSMSPNIDDHWLTLPQLARANQTQTHLRDQANKIRECISTIATILPQTNILTSQTQYFRFLHAWSIVNTRCFYYLRPGQPAPADSNEAMALCPFQDLFNHSSLTKGCETAYDSRGFFVHADRDYDAGIELYLRYGKHSNDMLWMEYGFFLPENRDDEIRIDRVVFEGMKDEDKTLLRDKGYEGQYSLKWQGVCYRTIVASYLGVLGVEQWRRMVSGGFDPETSNIYTKQRVEAKRKIVGWILMVRCEAERNLDVLLGVDDGDDLVAEFVGEASLTEHQSSSYETKVELGFKRRDMCIRRWMQVFDMCMSAVGEIEGEFPGAFIVDGVYGRAEEDLGASAEKFVQSLKEMKKKGNSDE